MGDWYKSSATGGEASAAAADNNSCPSAVFRSRRSPVLSCHGSVATSQPLATQIGISILQTYKNSNAADASVAVAAALAVTEPCSTGLGGDVFALYYDNTKSNKNVACVNGSGKSPQALTRELLRQTYPDAAEHDTDISADAFRNSIHAVTVPGAAQGWYDVWHRHGSGNVSFAQLLEPAANLAQQGFPVAPVTAHHWRAGRTQITTNWWKNGNDVDNSNDDPRQTPLVPPDGGPYPGSIIRNPDLARVLRELGAHGPQKGFYQGATGRAIVEAVQHHGGCLTQADLDQHVGTFPEAMSVEYRGTRLWQHPPNGQGIAGLIALESLNRLEQTQPSLAGDNLVPGSADATHALLEVMRLGFADARKYVADPDAMQQSSVEKLLDPARIHQRVDQLYQHDRATIAGQPDVSSGTVSFQIVDQFGNAISMVNSNFMGFGTGLVPRGCGFTLQNRGFGFTLNELDHDNLVGPGKRPYHTIIPGMLTKPVVDDVADDDGTPATRHALYASLSNMGGHMQPQGHLQLVVNLVAGKMDPQQAIDAPRFCIADGTQGGVCFVEDEFDADVLDNLEQERGHQLRRTNQRSLFGKAQIIVKDPDTGVLWAGSDGRGDGCAMGY